MNSKFAILTDTTRCTGCEECVHACKERKGLGVDRPKRWNRSIDDLSETRLTTIDRRPDGRYVRRQCRHCVEPACASACLVGAMRKTAEGPVIYDSGKCIGCRYCMLACPFGVPRFEWGKPKPRVVKCDFCYEAIQRGEIDRPACVGACPYEATMFGTRDDMLKEAEQRIAKNPGKYYNNRIHGETEVGGTSVLYLSDGPMDFLSWKSNLGDRALPSHTEAALALVKPTAATVAGGMGFLYWIIGRRMALQNQKAAEAAASREPESDEGGATQ